MLAICLVRHILTFAHCGSKHSDFCCFKGVTRSYTVLQTEKFLYIDTSIIVHFVIVCLLSPVINVLYICCC